MPSIEILTAETEEGRQAIAEVMAHSYRTDLDTVHPEWALVRRVNGVPVAFILIDPDRSMQFPGGGLTYGFISNVATRKDRRWEGHFRAIMDAAFDRLKAANIPLVLTHGRFPLYRRFGFDVFTYNSGIFITPGIIEHRLGQSSPVAGDWITVLENHSILDDLLLVTRARADTHAEARNCLLAAAEAARQRRKTRILIEHPAAPSYGSTYPIYASAETPLTQLARACGARVIVQGANPEEGSVPDADWIKILDAPGFFRTLINNYQRLAALPDPAIIRIETDAGSFLLECTGRELVLSDMYREDHPAVRWPSSALAQLVTGYKSIEIICATFNTELPPEAARMLDQLFPPRWRFSRNESWTYK